MGFAAPLFLLGLVAIGLPFWLHRLQTRSSERRPFSSAMLLQTAEQRVHVKKKLKYLLLLALRVLLLAVLAFAFAGPFVRLSPAVALATAAGTHLVLVDTSASMGRSGALEQARDAARRAIDAAPDDALIQVMSADGSVRLHGDPGVDKAAARSALGAIVISAARLDFGDAMGAVERIASGMPAPVTLDFVSDFQSSGMPVRFADLVPAGVSHFVPYRVGTGEPFNWAAGFLRTTGSGLQFGLTGAGDREHVADVQLLLDGVPVATRGASGTGPQLVEFEMPELAQGDNRLEVRIETDDDFEADNRWYHVVSNEPPAPIPLLTLDPAGLPATYLAAALESAGRYSVETLVPGNFDPRVLGRYRWLVIDDLGLVDPALAEALTAFVNGGGNVLAFAGERAQSLDTLPLTGHRQRPATTLAAPGDFHAVGRIDEAHPALARAAGWQSVHVTRSLPVEPLAGDEVPIRLDDNAPLMIERRLGAGRVLLLPLHLDNRWSDLPVRPVFVSFVIDAAAYLAGGTELARAYTVGDSLSLSRAGNTSGQVVDPDGNRVLSLADTTRDQQVRLDKPGFYEVYNRDGQRSVAVNLDPRESGLERLDDAVLERWESAVAGQAPAGSTAAGEFGERSLELWRWALLLLALVVIGESIVGNMHLDPRSTERV